MQPCRDTNRIETGDTACGEVCSEQRERAKGRTLLFRTARGMTHGRRIVFSFATGGLFGNEIGPSYGGMWRKHGQVTIQA